MALGIAAAAIILFLGTGGKMVSQMARSWASESSGGVDPTVVSTLMLNVALIIFIMRRHRDLVREVAERRKAEDLARELADIDPLTGCLNRRSIPPATDKLMEEASRSSRGIAFIMIDLDDFKQVNDLNGHQAGDEILRTVAERIRNLLPRDALLGRLGGDEFAIVVSYQPMLPERINALITRIIESIAQPFELGTATAQITMSVGIAANHDTLAETGEAYDAQTLIHKADIAMYEAKKHGKNRSCWFEAPMEKALQVRNELEAAIRKGVKTGEFVPFYEQQIDLDTGELAGFEMLARWRSPDLGLIGPEVFIPIAEDIGIIGELSENLITQAFEDARDWDPALTLSVNISPVQLRDPWFSQKILKLLLESGFPANRLDLEITESCLLENIGVVRSMITSLKNQGVKISLDDFGTGYSSLAMLRSLPFDRIKVDRSFVGDIGKDETGSKIIKAIASLGDGLKVPVTAEGIENTIILETLKKVGKLKGQGYHYGKPEDAKAVRRRLVAADRMASLLDTPAAPEDDARRHSHG